MFACAAARGTRDRRWGNVYTLEMKWSGLASKVAVLPEAESTIFSPPAGGVGGRAEWQPIVSSFTKSVSAMSVRWSRTAEDMFRQQKKARRRRGLKHRRWENTRIAVLGHKQFSIGQQPGSLHARTRPHNPSRHTVRDRG